jgi:hypothetical protein
MNTLTKKCSACGIIKSVDDFGLKEGKYRRCYCKDCVREKFKLMRQRLGKTPARIELEKRQLERIKEKRKSNVTRGRFVLADSKKSDKKKGLNNDLNIEFVNSMLLECCYYCEDDKAPLGLDRIDNTKGHTQQNVVACCRRCNYIRRNMPYEAWVLFIPIVKLARTSGMFGDWNGTFKRDSLII